ncbi:MAG: hypothetical protein H0W33_14165 [Gammaproteobacteria bacterium]|nr:hypothetical protein [Gammaproteobacteria bacterium]
MLRCVWPQGWQDVEKAIHGFFNAAIRKCDFRIASIFKNLQFLKMAMHPCIA